MVAVEMGRSGWTLDILRGWDHCDLLMNGIDGARKEESTVMPASWLK